LYHQGNEQTTGGTAEAAAKPWLIPAGKYFAAHCRENTIKVLKLRPKFRYEEISGIMLSTGAECTLMDAYN